MRLVAKHISKTILLSMLVVTVVLVGLQFFIIFVSQLGDLGHGSYGVGHALIYTLMTLPLQVYALFPMAALLGSLIGLGILAANSELIVMRASGYSLGQITWVVMKTALLVVIVISAIGEFVGPITTEKAVVNKALAMSDGQALRTEHGTWVRNSHDFVRIETILPDQQLRGVTLYEFNGAHQLVKASYAKKAIYEKGHWVLQHVKQTIITPFRVSAAQLPKLVTKINLNPKILGNNILDPTQMSLYKLLTYIHYRAKSGLGTATYQLIFWQRVYQPLATAVMMFLAIPFIFGPLRSVTMGLRIVTGITVGFGFYLLNQFFGPLSLVYQISPVYSAILPTLLFFMIALGLFFRMV